MSNAVIVFSTCATRDEAERIAKAIVEDGLAACVQLLPPMRSVYRWQGAVQQSEEILLLIKTTETRFPQLENRIEELHSYDTPEIIAVPVIAGAQKYLTWLQDATQNFS
jgi:periplasmic divalent cation tolerance protein